MDSEAQQLLIITESVKNMMVARATGETTGADDYYELRGQMLQHPIVRKLAPRIVQTCRSLDEFWGYIKEQDSTYAGRRKHLAELFHPVLEYLEQGDTSPADTTIETMLISIDSPHIHAVWEKALERRATDPEGAITVARTLLEATCKHILDTLKVEYKEAADLPQLYSLAATQLNLSPTQHTEQIFKQILGGCHSVVQGLGSLRSKLGDAHSQGKRQVRPAPRHAELAVNLAGTMATFLFATLEALRAEE